MKYLNDSGLTYLWGKITDAISAVAATAGGGIASIKQALNSTSSEAFNIDSNNSLLNEAPTIASNAKYTPANTGVYAQGDYVQVAGKDIVVEKPILKGSRLQGIGHLIRATNASAASANHEIKGTFISGVNNFLKTTTNAAYINGLTMLGSELQASFEGANSSNSNIVSGVTIEGDGHNIQLSKKSGGAIFNLKGSHIEGYCNELVPASQNQRGVHIEGWWNELKSAANVDAAHIEGYKNRTTMFSSGQGTKGMHAEGCENIFLPYASGTGGDMSPNTGGYHVEGYKNSGVTYEGTHAEGMLNYTTGKCIHIQGNENTCTAPFGAHVEGDHNTSSGSYSHVEGQYNIASSTHQHVEGKYNIADANNDFAHIVGNGTADDARSNAYTLDWYGNGWYQGTVEATGLILKSSTTNSDKRFLITVDDSGTLSATEIVAAAGGEE